MVSWLQPRKRDGGYLSGLSRLAVEADQVCQEWSAYIGGRCNRRATLEATAGLEPPPKDPLRTAQAASLLLRMVLNLSLGSQLRNMLEPIVQEILEAVYREWPAALPCLGDLADSETCVANFERMVPFYSLVAGHKALAEQATSRAEAATTEAQRARTEKEPREAELAAERLARTAVEERLSLETAGHIAAENRVAELEENYRRFKQQTKHALSDYAEMQFSAQSARADVRNMLRDKREKESHISELQGQTHFLTHAKQELEEDLAQVRRRLEKKERETEQLPQLREKLELYESGEAVYGVAYAARIAGEVLNTTIEEITGRKFTGTESWTRKAALDSVVNRLRALQAEADGLKEQVKRLRWELCATRQLIPSWNMDAAQDLEDAYNLDAPVHRQVFSMRDQRCFAGLGMGNHVPPYLRAEGFVRHILVSKAEIEDFMQGFLEHLFSEERSGIEFDTEAVHNELYVHLTKHYDGDALTEFAYAFICSLEAFRDDPDFELFDMMLSGVVHPSITQDQSNMLKELQLLVRCCQEGQIEEPAHTSGRPGMRGAGGLTNQREQVSRRVMRALLQAVFPEKTPARHDALRRALHMTLQTLSDSGRSPNPDCAFISDLFSATADGNQSPLIEEVRRQHCYEIIDFTADLARALRRRPEDEANGFREAYDVDRKAITTALFTVDPHASTQRVDKLVNLACPDTSGTVATSEALRRLRHGTLLRSERLWVKALPKDVVDQLLAEVPQREDGKMVSATDTGAQPRRCRAVKVVDNPVVKMQSEAYNTPEGLQTAIGRPQRLDGMSEEKPLPP